MAQYIDKSALVAEIEKRKRRNILNEGAFEEDINILSFLNTLEVKEVNPNDAFIEKACDWLRNCLDNGLWVTNDVGETEKEAIIEHFKEAMKL